MKPYVILWSKARSKLEQEVNDHIDLGYVPQGGVTLVADCAMQAMFKKPTKNKPEPRSSKKHEYDPTFQKIWESFPKITGANKADTYAQYKKRLSEGVDWAIIGAGVISYVAHCKATGRWLMSPQAFMGHKKHYELDWTVPTQAETMPKDNNELVTWATNKGYRAPHPGEEYPQYRQAIAKLDRVD